MKLIITRPQHDVTTRYISAWAEEVIVFAKRKSIVVIDLLKDKSRRRELEGRIKKLAPRLIFLNGHGSPDSVCGHDDEVLIKVGENHNLLTGRITYALSCNSGEILGQKVAENKGTAYIGYKDEFIFIADRRYITRPLDDPRAKPFMESSNQVMTSILKGHSTQEASSRSKDIFREHYRKLSTSTTDVDSLQAAQFLWWNMRNQVCLGDSDSKI